MMFLFLCVVAAIAAPDGKIPVQGFLTDSADQPLDGTVPVEFRLYPDSSASAGTELWSSSRTLSVDDGAFSAYLGESTSLDLDLFETNSDVWLVIDVNNGGDLGPFEVGAVPTAGFAHGAADAARLAGQPASNFASQATLSQLLTDFAELSADVVELQTDNATLAAQVTALETDVTDLQTDNATLALQVSALETDVADLQTDNATLAVQVSALETDVTDLQTDNVTLATQVADLETDVADLQTDNATLTSGLSDANDTITDLLAADVALLSDVGDLTTDVDGLLVDVPDLDTRVSDIEADYLTAADIDDMATETWVLSQLSSGGVGLIDVDTTIAVPADYPDVSAALASLDGTFIAADAIVTITIADGTYAHAAPVEIRHPQGSNIAILGNLSNPDNVVLEFTGTDGVVLDNGRTLGLLDGVTLRGTSVEKGIHLSLDSALRLGPEVVVEMFGNNVQVNDGSTFYGDSLTVRDADVHGVVVQRGSNAYLEGATSINNGSLGIYATGTSTIRANYATVTGNGGTGVRSQNGSSISASHSVSNNNTRGFMAEYNSLIYANGATATNNSEYGAYGIWESLIRIDVATVTNNQTGFRAHGSATLITGGGTTSGNATTYTPAGNTYQQQHGGYIRL